MYLYVSVSVTHLVEGGRGLQKTPILYEQASQVLVRGHRKSKPVLKSLRGSASAVYRRSNTSHHVRIVRTSERRILSHSVNSHAPAGEERTDGFGVRVGGTELGGGQQVGVHVFKGGEEDGVGRGKR